MKSKERIELTNWEKIQYYSISLWLLIPFLMFLYFHIQLLFELPNQKDFTLLFFGVIFLTVSILIFLLNKKRTYFEEYKGKLSNADFKKAIKITAKELQWNILKITNDSAKAVRYPEALGNGGEIITIKKTTDKVLVNSIRNFEDSNGFSSNRNKENVYIFSINAAQILRGEYIEKTIRERKRKKEEHFWNENEWSFGNIMMRVFGYGLFLFFLLLSIYGIREGAWEGIFLIFISFAIGLTYIRTDIKILIEKRKRKFNK